MKHLGNRHAESRHGGAARVAAKGSGVPFSGGSLYKALPEATVNTAITG